jgi:hypothetical protein
MTGASIAKLNGTAYAGLKLTDMIKSAVKGWQLNKKVNGYTPWNDTAGFSGPALPQNLSSAGVVNAIPVCDYSNQMKPGTGCPNIFSFKTPCAF